MVDKSGSIAFGSFAVGYTDVTQTEIKQNAWQLQTNMKMNEN